MRILIIQLRRIGDILLTTPVAAYLKQALPDATIDFLCEPMGKAVLETNPNLQEVLIHNRLHSVRELLRVRARRYDVVLDFLNNPRSAHLARASGARWRVGFQSGFWGKVCYNLAVPVPKEPEYVPSRKIRMARHWLKEAGLVSPEPASVRPELTLAPEDIQFSADWASKEGLNEAPFAVLAPAHRHPIRAWRSDGFRSVALYLARERGMKVFLAWGPGEETVMAEVRRGHETEIALLPLTTLRQMAAVFKRAAVVVTNDSGAMHLAVSMGTPTVTIYGPTRPIDWNPSLADAGRKDIALTANGVPCLGCHLHKCPVGHICMTQLADERVMAACDFVLKET